MRLLARAILLVLLLVLPAQAATKQEKIHAQVSRRVMARLSEDMHKKGYDTQL